MASVSRGVAALAAAMLVSGCIPQMGGDRPYRPVPPPPAPPPSAPPPSPPPHRASPRTVRQPAPAWATRPVTPDAATIPDSVYVVRAGDTLRSIGNRTGAGSEAIARANHLAPPFLVRTGQRLTIPGGRYHLVRAGESGVAIARAYGVSWSDVATINDLQPPYILRTGQRLQLPSAREVAAMSLEDRARAFQLDIDDLATGSEPAIAPSEAPARPSASPARPVPTSKAVAEPSRFAGRFDWPLTGAIIGRFGPAGDGRRNDGINIAAERGTPIRAAADGVVAYAGSAIAVYGGLILLKHGDGWITAYGHAEDILVTRGQAVKRGEVIGHAGATGSVNRPQLHFEMRAKRTPVDPLRYLPARG
ncbi:LysM peptidoglycan-binding domain-containing M23 family metallopeptidase [Sphingomonas morindae]|uniref:LysM peptidoglycan-binding domain-containing M23 family metallopeptidase n=1 Tax=Sphingomonas morindae TaxID=1541170 RepID=A0ABY4X5C8_9SPHN|nr:LysM peptidoglycan-binding domain-containing M23 family metallopeptidase [Sphingomonas morindae]USI72104.1 LysM peptidoglycan-binding domain-containing M23 family metallopeptidase [Sphingomonas morindae]